MIHKQNSLFYEDFIFLTLIYIHLSVEVFQHINPFFVYFRDFHAFTNTQTLFVCIQKCTKTNEIANSLLKTIEKLFIYL